MKLYYAPGACSLASHIVLREADLPYQLVKVNLSDKTTEDGADFRTVNAKGYVPALALDEGGVLTENGAVLQYLADRRPQAELAPRWDTMERYRLQEWLTFIGTEIHKVFGPLWNPKVDDATRKKAVAQLASRFDYVVDALGDRPYLIGDRFTVADAYLFTVLRWSDPLKVDLARWPTLTAYVERIAERPAVRKALEEEGIAN